MGMVTVHGARYRGSCIAAVLTTVLCAAGCGGGSPSPPAALNATQVSTLPIPTAGTAPTAPLGPFVDRVFRIDATDGWISGQSYIAVIDRGQLRAVVSDRRVFGISPIDRESA